MATLPREERVAEWCVLDLAILPPSCLSNQPALTFIHYKLHTSFCVRTHRVM